MFGGPSENANGPAPDKLKQLDELLVSERRIQMLRAKHNGHRVQVVVERCSIRARHWVSERDFKATAVFQGAEYTAYGAAPSKAFAQLVTRLVEVIDRFDERHNVVPIAGRRVA